MIRIKGKQGTDKEGLADNNVRGSGTTSSGESSGKFNQNYGRSGQQSREDAVNTMDLEAGPPSRARTGGDSPQIQGGSNRAADNMTGEESSDV